MDTQKIRRRFRQRIFIERRVLELVNNSLVKCAPLSGLTNETLKKWEYSVFAEYGNQALAVIETIKQISIKCQIDSDCSRDVFSEKDLEVSCSIEELINSLKVKLELSVVSP